jgi:hypothetical protein
MGKSGFLIFIKFVLIISYSVVSVVAELISGTDTIFVYSGVNFETQKKTDTLKYNTYGSIADSSIDFFYFHLNTAPVGNNLCSGIPRLVGTIRPFWNSKKAFDSTDYSKKLNLDEPASFTKIDSTKVELVDVPMLEIIYPADSLKNKFQILKTKNNNYVLVRILKTIFSKDGPERTSIKPIWRENPGQPPTLIGYDTCQNALAFRWFMQTDGTTNFPIDNTENRREKKKGPILEIDGRRLYEKDISVYNIKGQLIAKDVSSNLEIINQLKDKKGVFLFVGNKESKSTVLKISF